MEDEALIQLYWDRDEQAITATHEKYGSWCRGIAMRILDHQQETEECVSDTYLQVWNNIPPQRPGIFRAWLGKITRNLALSRYRKAHAEKRGGGQTALALEELEECISGGHTIESEQERREIVHTINAFLASLPERQRNVFLRRYWHMTAVGDIAKSYGMSEGQVSSMLHRSRKKLRTMLEKEGIPL